MKFGGNNYDIQLTNTGRKKQRIHAWHTQNSFGCDINTNDSKERDKEARLTIDISHVQGLHSDRGYEGDGGTEPIQTHKSPKRGAICAINLIKEKICWKLKGRKCAYWRPQKCYTSKEDASSPTICLDSLFPIIMIDVHEWRDEAIFDVPRGYLNTDITKEKASY